MKEMIMDTLIDSLKLFPFLFLAFLFIELFEHKFSKNAKKTIIKSGKFGPFFGSLFGLFPQCGFSVMATNLYVTKILSLGTLIAIYLSTSDEMLPILLSRQASWEEILGLLGTKFLVGIIFGFLIDFLFSKKYRKENVSYHICEEDNCHCEKGIFLSSLHHTFHTFLFIVLATFALNTLIYCVGEEQISKIFLGHPFFAPFLSSLLGLLPNCASSVVITELYLSGVISFGTTIAGLLTGSGVAILVLFQSNRNLKENFTILSLIYGIGVFVGILIEAVGFLL